MLRVDSMCRPPGSWEWGDLPNPVAYAHRQRCAALRAKAEQPNSQMVSEKSSTIKQPSDFGEIIYNQTAQ